MIDATNTNLGVWTVDSSVVVTSARSSYAFEESELEVVYVPYVESTHISDEFSSDPLGLVIAKPVKDI